MGLQACKLVDEVDHQPPHSPSFEVIESDRREIHEDQRMTDAHSFGDACIIQSTIKSPEHNLQVVLNIVQLVT